MKKVLFIFLIITSAVNAQELKLTKATMQTINHGASPTSTTTYYVQFEKKKKTAWSIDSVVSISSSQLVKYTLVKMGGKGGADYTGVEKFSKSDKGPYQIKFAVTKQRSGSGRPGAPQNQKADTTVIEGGVVIYYSIKGKSKQLKVVDFEKLETVDAP